MKYKENLNGNDIAERENIRRDIFFSYVDFCKKNHTDNDCYEYFIHNQLFNKQFIIQFYNEDKYNDFCNRFFENSKSKVVKVEKTVSKKVHVNLDDLIPEYKEFFGDEIPKIWDDDDFKLYEEFKQQLKAVKLFNIHYKIGLILWMTFVFWFPFLLGGLIEADINFVAGGIGGICLFAFTTPVTLPLSFFIGGYVHPIILKKILFDKTNVFYDHQKNFIEKQTYQNLAAITAGTVIGNYIK